MSPNVLGKSLYDIGGSAWNDAYAYSHNSFIGPVVLSFKLIQGVGVIGLTTTVGNIYSIQFGILFNTGGNIVAIYNNGSQLSPTIPANLYADTLSNLYITYDGADTITYIATRADSPNDPNWNWSFSQAVSTAPISGSPPPSAYTGLRTCFAGYNTNTLVGNVQFGSLW